MAIEDLINTRIKYHYTEGVDWAYEMWYRSSDRVVYRVRNGPLEGRSNYVRAWYQEIKAGEMYKISWLEETGSVVSQTLDLKEKKIWTFAAFSKGHHENRQLCQGKKTTHLEQWRELAKIGIQTDRYMIPHSGIIDEIIEGPGEDLLVIEDDWPTL